MLQRREYKLSIPAPSSANSSTRRRQTQAAARAVDALQHVVNTLGVENLDLLYQHIETALKEGNEDQGGQRLNPSLLGDVTCGREYTPEERVVLEIGALVRSYRLRSELLADSLTAPQVAELLDTSRQTPHDRARKGSLLAVLDRGSLRFPAWQFDPEGPDGVIAGLPRLLRALQVSPLAKVSWLKRTSPYLEGRTPVEALREGDIDRVVGLAEAVGVS